MLKSQKLLFNIFKSTTPLKYICKNQFPPILNYFKSIASFTTKTESYRFNNPPIEQSYVPITVLSIKDNKGARFAKTKLGRGPGSGKGKTAGRGHKGFKAHVGNVNRHYEGGQVPITRRLPKHGFRRNAVKLRHSYINLDKIYYLIQKGRINPKEPITGKHILWSGGVSKIVDGVKLLSRGCEFLKDLPPLHFEISSASERAIEEIKKHGGTVTCVYKNKLTLRAQAKPWKFYKPLLDPTPRYKMVKKLLSLEDKGAIVRYNKPKWMEANHPRERELKFKTKLAKMKNAELLPEYPIKRVPHMNDDKIRERRPFIWRKISYDHK